MKKVIFMALAAVFMLSSGFTINNATEIQSDGEPCIVTVTATRQNQYGDTETVRRVYISRVIDADDEDCESFGNHVMYFMCLELNGFNSGC